MPHFQHAHLDALGTHDLHTLAVCACFMVGLSKIFQMRYDLSTSGP